jgi:hypothetical protein
LHRCTAAGSGRTADWRGRTAGGQTAGVRHSGRRALDSGHGGGTARPRGTASGRASAARRATHSRGIPGGAGTTAGRGGLAETKRLLPVSFAMEFFYSMLGCNAIGPKSTGYAVAHPAYPVATPLAATRARMWKACHAVGHPAWCTCMYDDVN